MPEVIALAGWPPEALAYAFAMYSRSPLSIKESIAQITQEKSGKFLETYYFQYGHASIADNAHIPLACENISEIAAYELEDDQLWDGQERSTRYQKFGVGQGYFVPGSVRGTPLEARYASAADFMLEMYQLFSDKAFEWLTSQLPKPSEMKPEVYERNLKARAFDISRYWLFNGILTSVGQITNARTLESQISRLMSSEYPELRELALTIKKAVGEERPFCPENRDESPVAPTLVKYTEPSQYQIELRQAMRTKASELLGSGIKSVLKSKRYVTLTAPSLEDELIATLLFQASNEPYKWICNTVCYGLKLKQKEDLIDLALAGRGPRDQLPKAMACGHQLQFDVCMDRGGERDLHRHRNCIQIHQPLSVERGWDRPGMVSKMGLDDIYDAGMAKAGDTVRELEREIGVDAHYLIPFAFRSGTLYKMHLAQAAYVTELRSGIKGHFSYREIACQMHDLLVERLPLLARHCRVTPFKTEDLLKR